MGEGALLMIQKSLCGAISVSIVLAAVPAIRTALGVFGIGIVASSFSLYFLQSDHTVSYIWAIRTGITVSIPLLLSNELISFLAKSLEILRGSQLAEQLFVQERGGPIEFGLFLFLGTMFLSAGGGELLLTQVGVLNSGNGKERQLESLGTLDSIYQVALEYVFSIAGLGVVLELFAGIFQRVLKRSYLGAELSSMRVFLVILLFLDLIEGG